MPGAHETGPVGRGRADEPRFEAGIAHLHRYVAIHGSSSPSRTVTVDGFPIGQWVDSRRTDYRVGRMPTERIRRIETEFPDWQWNVLDTAFSTAIEHLHRYAAAHGTSNASQHDVIDGFPIGQWVANRRVDYRKGRLATDRISLFEREFPDWQWNPQGVAFETGIVHLRRFLAKHGSSNPRKGDVIDGFNIGQWAANRRADYRRGTLTAERIERLESDFPDWRWAGR
ncbi:helicase associated domain-containing protein (plasmid) [Gordonia rubripertincta]|uniref:Helicase associated domain-containing protein n=1 Tax=Gordonia rubripertincta TaxID=36822 RepID=A0AAW6RFD1_GORRU|nr:helicase associated domain-containing protein [Gordonia rubripertincta]MCZ4537948.1 helicase associated domain-containing protein [Gordonia terrae]MDG6782983.1 helicase associated domain-containing protein [Gordonia rubripertincta]